MAGVFPGCSQLWTKAVPCEAEEVFHYLVLDGGTRLNHNLDLEENQREISYQCKSNLAKLIMPSSQEVEEEVVYLPWNCYICSSNGPTPMLTPEAPWCYDCQTDKMACAEAVLSTLTEAILDTWTGGFAEGASNALISTVTGKDIHQMAWNLHNRANSGLMEKAWTDPR